MESLSKAIPFESDPKRSRVNGQERIQTATYRKRREKTEKLLLTFQSGIQGWERVY